MGKFDGCLLISDFDDTICIGGRTVPERNLEALDYWCREGGLFTVATGRAHRTFAPCVHMVPVNAPVILSNGSALYDFEKNVMLEQTFLPDSAPADLWGILKKYPSMAMEAYHGEDIYAWNPNAITDFHMQKVGTDYAACAIEDMPLPWTKAILQDQWENGQKAQQEILERYGDRYEAIFSNRVYLEITRKGSSKGGMALRLCRRLGISPRHLYCAGDNQNDIDLLEKAAIPFAPSDCAQVVKDWGARIGCSCAEGILGYVVETLDSLY